MVQFARCKTTGLSAQHCQPLFEFWSEGPALSLGGVDADVTGTGFGEELRRLIGVWIGLIAEQFVANFELAVFEALRREHNANQRSR